MFIEHRHRNRLDLDRILQEDHVRPESRKKSTLIRIPGLQPKTPEVLRKDNRDISNMSSSALRQDVTQIRVKRKRWEDPLPVLGEFLTFATELMNKVWMPPDKKKKQSEPAYERIYQLSTVTPTAEVESLSTVTSCKSFMHAAQPEKTRLVVKKGADASCKDIAEAIVDEEDILFQRLSITSPSRDSLKNLGTPSQQESRRNRKEELTENLTQEEEEDVYDIYYLAQQQDLTRLNPKRVGMLIWEDEDDHFESSGSDQDEYGDEDSNAEDYWANDYPDEEEDILLMQSRPLVYDSDTDNSLRHVSSSSDDEEDYTI